MNWYKQASWYKHRQARYKVANTPKTLYHGTLLDNEDFIKRDGVVPMAGALVENFYGDYTNQLPEVAFFADKENIRYAISAMEYHIKQKLDKLSITPLDIFNHGMIVVTDIDSGDIQQKPEKEPPMGDPYEYPLTVEPSDYYSEESVIYNKLIKGRALIKLMKIMGDPIFLTPQKQINYYKAKLIAKVIEKHPDQTKQTIIDKVNSLTPEQVKKYIQTYNRM